MSAPKSLRHMARRESAAVAMGHAQCSPAQLVQEAKRETPSFRALSKRQSPRQRTKESTGCATMLSAFSEAICLLTGEGLH